MTGTTYEAMTAEEAARLLQPGCGVCRFYLHARTAAFPEAGMCRRYAPRGPAIGDGRWQIFPPMLIHHWCGDFEESPDMRSAIEARIAVQNRSAGA